MTSPVGQQPWTYPPAYRPQEPSGPSGLGAPPPGYAGEPIIPARRRSKSATPVVASIAVTVGLVGIVAVLAVAWRETSAGSTLIAFLAALVPLGVVMAAVFWLDRWEPEPRGMLALAFLWGAGVSTATALVINTYLTRALYTATDDAGLAEGVGVLIIAPLVEESLKGLWLLVLFLKRRRLFDGPVDGVVYAATIAAGFAFTENIVYFARGDMAEGLGQVFFGRAVMSPFAHIIFTACMGLAIGGAVRMRRRSSVLLVLMLGWLGAVVLHSGWNGASLLGDSFLLVYVLAQMPLFAGFLVLVVWLRHRETRVLQARLGEYLVHGWYAPHEVDMLTSLRRRADALRWAGQHGPRAREAMARFQRNSTRLALLRGRIVAGRVPDGAAERERRLLESLTASRDDFARAAGPRAG